MALYETDCKGKVREEVFQVVQYERSLPPSVSQRDDYLGIEESRASR